MIRIWNVIAFTILFSVPTTVSAQDWNVRCVQLHLDGMAYDVGPIDGLFGRNTKIGADAFLEADGAGLSLPALTRATAEQWCQTLRPVCPAEGCMSAIREHLAESKAKLIAGRGLDYCQISPTFRASPGAPEMVVDTTQQGHSSKTQALGGYLNSSGSLWYFNDKQGTGKAAIDTLESWADADAYQSFRSQWGIGSSAYWPTYSGIAITLNTLFLLDNHPELTPERRNKILDWVGRVLDRTKVTGQLTRREAAGGLQWRNNHNARRALILLYYGIHREDEDLIRKSLSDIQRSFDAIDANNVPIDAERGDWALNYINLGLDSMVLHTAFMSILDPDYPRFRSDIMPKLDGAVAFLFEEVREPDRVHRYARANVGRPQSRYSGTQEIWLKRPGPEGYYWAWVDSDVTDLLPNGQKALRETMSSHFGFKRAKWNDTGGNVSCWFPD